MKLLRNIVKRRGISKRRGSYRVSADGALRTRKGNTYLRILASKKVGRTQITGKGSHGSRGSEYGTYLKRGNSSGGMSYNPNSKQIRPSLIIKKKKIM